MDIDTQNKHTDIAKDIFEEIDNNGKYIVPDKSKKDFKDTIKKIVSDFPIILEYEKTKGKEIVQYSNYIFKDDEELNANLLISLNDATYYNFKNFDADSKTVAPLKLPKNVIKDYICANNLCDKAELIDFVGNASRSKYYKLIKHFIKNDNKYIAKTYKDIAFPDEIKDRIDFLEKCYEEALKQNKNKIIKLEQTTAQLLFPAPNGDGYIAVTPTSSFAMIDKISKKINDIDEAKRVNYKETQKLFKKIKSLKQKYKKTNNEKYKNEITNLEELLLDLEDSNNFDIKTTIWQKMIGKRQNLGFNAPSFRAKIFYTTAPNYDYKISRDLLFEYNLEIFIKKEIRKMIAREKETVKMKIEKLEGLLHKYSDAQMPINRRDKDNQIILFKKIFYLFYETSKDKILDKKDNAEEIVSIFILTIISVFKKDVVISNRTFNIFKDELKTFLEKLLYKEDKKNV